MGVNEVGMGPVQRSEVGCSYPYQWHPYTDLEKRQLFLRSYQFCRKKTVAERIRGSFFRVKRVIWVRLRSARKIRKLVWLRLRYGLFYSARRRRFLRLYSYNNKRSSSSSCFW